MKKVILCVFILSISSHVLSASIEQHLKSISSIDTSIEVEENIKKIELIFFEDLKTLQAECEQEYLSIRLNKGQKISSRARLTAKEKKICLSKSNNWSRQFREAKFELRKKALKSVYQDQLQSLDRLKNKVPTKNN